MEHPAIAFKSSVSTPAKGVTKCVGINSLLTTLKKLNPRNENLKVGVVGNLKKKTVQNVLMAVLKQIWGTG